MRYLLKSFSKDEGGATMVEYAFMVALIAMVCLVAVQNLGGTANQSFIGINQKLENLNSPQQGS